MKKIYFYFVLIGFVLLFNLCQKKTAAKKKTQVKTPVIYTTFYPTTYFTEIIGGNNIKVVCPCPEDEDAIFWMPDTDTIAKYQQADLIIINGAGFEKWVEKVSLPEEKIVNTAKEFTDEFIKFENVTTHSHGKTGEHSHEGIDGHTWLDPILALKQADEIKKALDKEFPHLQKYFDQGFIKLEGILLSLDKKISDLTANYQNQPILCSHPAYNYLARRYNWNIKNLDLDPESDLTNKQINEIKNIMKTHKAKYLIWESKPVEKIEKLLKDKFNLTSITFSPAELIKKSDLDEGYDYIAIMNENIVNIKPVFE